MTKPLSVNDLLNDAQERKKQALSLISKPDVSAEDLETAERLMKEAEDLANRSARMSELLRRADFVKGANEVHGDEDHREGPDGWKSFGEFLLSVKAASSTGRRDTRLKYFENDTPESERKDLSESVGSAGGFLVPTEFRPELMQAVQELSIIRPRAMVIPMARRSIEVPALKQSGTIAGQPHWFGGMLAYWESEAAQLQETEPAFRYITLTAHELTAVTHASNNLLSDSAISLSALLTGPRGFPGVVAWKEDYAFLRGSGVGEPLGIVNAPATIAVSRTTPGTVVFDDLVKMEEKLLPSANAIWIASISLKSTLMLMHGPTDTDYAGTYLWGSAKDGAPDQLLGRPIIFTEKLPAKGTSGDIILVDPSHYYIGDRQSTTIDSTDQVRWLRNQTSWKVTHRVDGQPWMDTFFTLADGTSTVSPFVKLT